MSHSYKIKTSAEVSGLFQFVPQIIRHFSSIATPLYAFTSFKIRLKSALKWYDVICDKKKEAFGAPKCSVCSTTAAHCNMT